MDTRIGFWEKLKAYHLKNNVVVLIVLILIFVISIFAYLHPSCRNNDVLANIALALFTSLLATIFAMIAEIYVSYKSSEKDKFLEDIHVFGIEYLNLNKTELLKKLLKDSDRDIWISGYRLILTNNIKKDIAEAVKRGANVTTVICPPWSKAFELVYGANEKVVDNYYSVFHAIYEAVEERGGQVEKHKVYIVNKPIFSDTYKIDQTIVTGPYLHNRDKEYKRIMAKDFFSYVLVRESPLYQLIKNEYETLLEEAYGVLDWEKFEQVYKHVEKNDFNEREKIQCLEEAFISI